MSVHDLVDISIGELMGLATALVIIIAVIYRRFRSLSSIDFRLHPPPVPRLVLVVIKTAEADYYQGQAAWRRAIEALQDMLSFLAPGLVYKLNFSVGRYRIKPKTIDVLVDWCIEQGWLQMHSEHDQRSRAFIAYFSHQPAINDWQISVYLEWLRRDHPQLNAMDWDAIAADDEAIAKLYSGYMGAGGAWEAWRSNSTPGAEARKRLQYDEQSGSYRLIDGIRGHVS